MSIFWQNSNNLAKKCSTTPAGPVHSSPATQLDTRISISTINIRILYSTGTGTGTGTGTVVTLRENMKFND